MSPALYDSVVLDTARMYRIIDVVEAQIWFAVAQRSAVVESDSWLVQALQLALKHHASTRVTLNICMMIHNRIV